MRETKTQCPRVAHRQYFYCFSVWMRHAYYVEQCLGECMLFCRTMPIICDEKKTTIRKRGQHEDVMDKIKHILKAPFSANSSD